MHYLYLAATIILEVAGTTLLEISDGFSKLLPGLSSFVLYGGALFFLSKALQQIDYGVAYATWCSAGIVLTSIISAVAFGQKLNTLGVICIVVIIAGCVVLNLFGTAD